MTALILGFGSIVITTADDSDQTSVYAEKRAYVVRGGAPVNLLIMVVLCLLAGVVVGLATR